MLNKDLNPPILSNVQDVTSVGFLDLNSDGVINHVNAAALRLLDLPEAGVVGRSLLDLGLHAEQFEGGFIPVSYGDPVLRSLLSPPCKGVVLRVPRADGGTRYLAVNAEKQADSSGAFRNLASLFDITPIMAARDFSGKIIRTSPVIKVSTNSAGLITLFNPAAEAAFECSARDVVGKKFVSEFFNFEPFVNSRAEQRLSGVNAGKVDVSDFLGGIDRVIRTEFCCAKKCGTRFMVDLSVVPLIDNDGQLYGYLYNAIDITERKIAEKKILKTLADLERSNSELEGFAYIASHDLQAPLRHISSYVDLLSRKLAGSADEDVVKWMGFIVTGAESMKNLIDGLLTFARVRGSGSDHLRETVSLRAVVSKIINYFSSVYPEVSFQVDPLPVLKGNAAQLEQLFQNLLQNAIKFRRPDVAPRIVVTATDQGSEYRFTVQDNGIGIDKSQFSRVFRLFQRLHTKDKFPGSGIGLAVCKKIIASHGGKIWIESEPGSGASFCFTLAKDLSDATDLNGFEWFNPSNQEGISGSGEKL